MSRYLSLRAKLVVLTFTLLTGFSIVVGVYLKAHFADQLLQELLKRGVSIAQLLSTLSANAFINGDTLYLDYLAKDQRQGEEDIDYILMLGPHGEVLAHSFADTYPVDLPTVNPLPEGQTQSLARVDLGGTELIYDIAVPVLDGRPGSIHLGLSATTLNYAVNSLVVKILAAIALTGVFAMGVALVASRQIAWPITRLTQAVKALAGGARSLSLPVVVQDEVGQLITAFNVMVEELGRAEQRIVHQKQFLETLLDDIPVPVFYKDQQGRMLGCNRAYCAFWGHDKAYVIDREAVELYTAAEAKVHLLKDAEVLRGQEPVRYELEVKGADNQCRQIVFHKAPFVDQDNFLAGIVGVMLDITKERRAEEFQREFVSTVAHEFQTPLATIIGFAELLLQGSLDEKTTRESCQAILGKAEGLSGMVDELLDLTCIETGRTISVKTQEIDLQPVLVEAVESFRAGCPDHELTVNIPGGPLRVAADRDRLIQVVDNLLDNAVKYSPPGTPVAFDVVTEEQRVCIVVADHGIGMTEEQRKHLFEKYYRANTANTAPSGTGLGLYICKAIIDAHGGDIRVESSVDHGTTVTVCLPRSLSENE